MSTQFVSRLDPPGEVVLAHPLPPSRPSSSEQPATFSDALQVRIAVFIEEQNCELANEIDEDDPRCWHWVVYSSVSQPAVENAHSGSGSHDPEPSSLSSSLTVQAGGSRRVSETSKKPIGTIRLVPPPHAPHPEAGRHYAGNEVGGRPVVQDRVTSLHDGREPYVKLGRLATLKDYRRFGLGRLLVNEALKWAAENGDQIRGLTDVEDPVKRERWREALGGGEGAGAAEWNGLCLVHAQVDIERFWASCGFVKDEGMGEWWEEGIKHVGMWRRLEMPK
ncbi:hypothetical protein MMC25_002144 [Agyrium rufum]|nr:hypothetical protein [Agyrium rufum]